MNITTLIKYLPYLFQAAQEIPQVYEYIVKIREDLQQNAMWSAEAEAAFNKEVADLKTNPPDWWKE